MTDKEKAEQIEAVARLLSGSASAFRHGRRTTAVEKLTAAGRLLISVTRAVANGDNNG